MDVSLLLVIGLAALAIFYFFSNKPSVHHIEKSVQSKTEHLENATQKAAEAAQAIVHAQTQHEIAAARQNAEQAKREAEQARAELEAEKAKLAAAQMVAEEKAAEEKAKKAAEELERQMNVYTPPHFSGLGVDGMNFNAASGPNQLKGCNFNGKTFLCSGYQPGWSRTEACPYQMYANNTKGNWRWYLDNRDPDPKKHRCLPPTDGTPNYSNTLKMGPEYHLKSTNTYAPMGPKTQLIGCPVNGNYVCTNYNKNTMQKWQACPYQDPGNWRWDGHFDENGNPTKCTPPVDGVLNREQTLAMGPKYHLL